MTEDYNEDYIKYRLERAFETLNDAQGFSAKQKLEFMCKQAVLFSLLCSKCSAFKK